MKLSRNLTLFFVISVCFAALQIGCWQKNDKNPVAALPVSNFAANVAFKIVTPADKNASFSASIRSSAENPPTVTFQLKLANFGNSLTPFSLVKKQAPVVNGSATVTFESLPNTTVVGSLQIENGNIDGYSNFHGAADLNQGSNIVELAPVGSLMPQDVLANAVSEIVSSSTLLLKAPTTLATELAKIVSNLPLDSTSVYDEVLNNFSNRTGLPLVELLAPANAQTFTIGSSINIIASATDLDGSISKIEFYQNSTKIAEKSSLPFSFEWQPTATGTYAVYAKAIDNNAAVGVTASISVVVVDAAPTYTVTYNGNGNTSGLVPTDNQSYQSGAIVTVKDNTGNLTKTGYTFAGWNTAADGSGTSYNPAATFNMGATNVTLYAKWSLVPTYTVTYNGNGNTGGNPPIDDLLYQENATVTVKYNTNSLVKTGYIFTGWSTSADGSGSFYIPDESFPIGSVNMVLYANWVENYFSFDSSTGVLSGYSSNGPKSVKIPSFLNDAKVRSIGAEAFKLCQLTDVSIPDSIEYIGANAFAYNFLNKVTIPSSVNLIDLGAFQENLLSEIELGVGLTNIGRNAFANNKIVQVVIPPNVTKIGEGAFRFNQINSLQLNEKVATIELYAFANNQIPSISLPDSLTDLGVGAFYSNKLVSVVIPPSITKINKGTFDFNSLTSVTLPSNLKEIGEESFRNNQLTSVDLPQDLIVLRAGAFSNNLLTAIIIPDNVTDIESGAFSNNKISSLILGANVRNIDGFTNNQLSTLVLGPSVKTVSGFSNNQLTSISWSQNITTIRNFAFSNNKFTSLALPQSLSTIGESAFESNYQLSNVSIGSNVAIDKNAFSGDFITKYQLNGAGTYNLSQYGIWLKK